VPAADDERLLIEAAQRDPSRFAVLYEQNFERVYAFILRRVRERHDAQDLTSEVFRAALANLGRFEWRGTPFAAWLYRIASNAIADHFQETSRHRDAPVSERAVEQETDVIESRASLFRSVGQLPVDQRQVIVMRFAEERSIREIAEVMGKSEGAVKQLQFRAMQTLRTRMGVSHV
jgi:RNA polymerase sigma-70 factor (ECF subfamily)